MKVMVGPTFHYETRIIIQLSPPSKHFPILNKSPTPGIHSVCNHLFCTHFGLDFFFCCRMCHHDTTDAPVLQHSDSCLKQHGNQLCKKFCLRQKMKKHSKECFEYHIFRTGLSMTVYLQTEVILRNNKPHKSRWKSQREVHVSVRFY